jgi:hypothetical protein
MALQLLCGMAISGYQFDAPILLFHCHTLAVVSTHTLSRLVPKIQLHLGGRSVSDLIAFCDGSGF